MTKIFFVNFNLHFRIKAQQCIIIPYLNLRKQPLNIRSITQFKKFKCFDIDNTIDSIPRPSKNEIPVGIINSNISISEWKSWNKARKAQFKGEYTKIP